MKASVKENKVVPVEQATVAALVDSPTTAAPKPKRLPPVVPSPNVKQVDAPSETDLVQNLGHDQVKEKFQAGVKKATAFAELQRRHSVAVWHDIPPGVSFMTHPEDPTKTKWDLTLAAMILYSVTTVPWRIAFGMDAEGGWLALDIIVDIFFFFDILVSFRTGYFDGDGKMEWSGRKIAKHYLRSWFMIDFISTVPIDHLATLATSDGPSGLRLVKLVRLVRLVRLAKLMKLINFDDFLEGHAFLDQNRGLVSILAMLLQISFIAHLMGCIWYNAAVNGSDGDNKVIFHEPSWITDRYGVEGAGKLDVWKKYTASIYWAITTMATVGYGDINTQNDTERAFAVLAMCVGASAFGYTIGIISDLIQNSNVEKVKKREKMNRLLHYCLSVECPYWLKKRLKKQWEFDCLKRGVFNEEEMLGYMPLQVRESSIKKGKYLQLVKQVPFLFKGLKYADVDYTVAVIQRLRYLVMKPGDVLFEARSVGWHTYFVCQGELTLQIENASKNAVVTDTDSDAPVKRDMVTVQVKDRKGKWADMIIGENKSVGHNFTIPGDGSVSQYRVVATGFQNELCALNRESVAEIAELWPDLVDKLEEGREDLMKTVNAFRVACAGDQPPSEDQEEAVASIEEFATESQRQRAATQSDLEKGIFHNPSSQELWKDKILYPESNRKVNWDLFVGACILVSVIVEPLRLGFDLQSQGAGSVIDAIIDATFWIDMILSFRTAYFTEQRRLIYDGKAVAIHYLKGWFTIDFITTLPVDRIAGSFVSDPADLRVVKILRVLRLFRLAKLAKIMQNGPLFEKFEDLTQGINQSFFNLCFLILVLLMAAHLIGCSWHFATGADGWAGDYFCGPTLDGDDDCGRPVNDETPVATKYLTSFYWALATMTTVGYGDISANGGSIIEMVIAMVSMLIGTTTFAYIIGELVMAVLNYDPADKELKIKKRSIKKFIEERNLPGTTVEQTRKGLKFSAEYSSIFESRTLLSEIPEFLLRMLVDIKYGPTINRFTLFPNLEELFPGSCSIILPMLRPVVCERSTWVFSVGAKISAAYFIQKGSCRLHDPNRNSIMVAYKKKIDESPETSDQPDTLDLEYQAGDSFAATTLFIPKGSRFRLKVGIKAIETCNLLVLVRTDYMKIQEICPSLFTNLRIRWKNRQLAEQWIGDCDWGTMTK